MEYTSSFKLTDTEGELIHDFRHQLLRVWQMPPEAFLESITSVETLESFADRLWDIETWQELHSPQ